MEERKRSVTVAIDFGTTYSGFGFAEANVSGESGIQVFRGWGRGQGFSFYKTPTSVLLAPDGNFSKFGHAAVEAYAKNLAKGNNQDIIYFERFKLVLYNTKASGLFTLSRPAHGYLLSQLLLISWKFLHFFFLLRSPLCSDLIYKFCLWIRVDIYSEKCRSKFCDNTAKRTFLKNQRVQMKQRAHRFPSDCVNWWKKKPRTLMFCLVDITDSLSIPHERKHFNQILRWNFCIIMPFANSLIFWRCFYLFSAWN